MEPNKRPAPPESLRQRVHGPGSVESFRLVGEVVCSDMLKAIRSRLALTANSRVLDFGCGCGRVATHFRLKSEAELCGVDIDGEAIEWCRENLSDVADFRQNAIAPPLPFKDASFDFVYAISIFTHLPQRMETAWLTELRRVTKPGGFVLLTTHGPHLLLGAPKSKEGRAIRTMIERLKARLRRHKLRRVGFFHFDGGGTEGLPKFYGVSYHTHQGIRAQWGRLFEIETIIPQGIGSHQDLILCRRPLCS
jgi:SAM-dependent methyltransferase